MNVDHLVNDEIFETLWRFLSEVGIEPDRAGSVVAAAPLRFHSTDKKVSDLYVDNRFPFTDQRHGCDSKLIAVPGFEDQLTFGFVGAGTNVKLDGFVG